MGASARDAHVISPRSNATRSGFDCRRAPVGATLYSPGSKNILHEYGVGAPRLYSEYMFTAHTLRAPASGPGGLAG